MPRTSAAGAITGSRTGARAFGGTSTKWRGQILPLEAINVAAALEEGIVLFTSKAAEHIAAIASVLDDPNVLRAGAAARNFFSRDTPAQTPSRGT